MAEENGKKSNPDIDVVKILGGTKTAVADTVERVFQGSPVGAISTAIGNSFYGINHRQTPGAIPINKDYFGLTFFTRPRLNLTSENLRAVRLLTPLLTTERASIQRIIRCLLDPELAAQGRGIDSPFVDESMAFIPILTNNLLSMNGWPDVVAPTSTSQDGVYKEAFSLVDGLTVNYSTYDITANFRNIPGDPITLLFLVWLHYASLVCQGVLVPYPDAIIQNEVDYNTRIYRLVLDSTKTKVQKIGACGAAFPTSSPIGAAFNFEADRPINASNDQISIQFRCMGAIYQDDILIDEFNRTVGLFNDGMDERKFSRDKNGILHNPNYRQVPIEALGIFNNRGYPHIDIQTYELGWWVSNDTYNYFLPVWNEQKQIKESHV